MICDASLRTFLVEKVVSVVVDTAESLEELRQRVDELLGAVGEAEREVTTRTVAFEAGLQAVRDSHDIGLKASKQTRDALVKQLTDLVGPRREELFKPGTATIRVSNGDIALIYSSPALDVLDEKLAIKCIRRLRLANRYLRWKHTVSIDKVALKDAPKDIARIEGVKLRQKVEWYIRPGKSPGTTISTPADVGPPKLGG